MSPIEHISDTARWVAMYRAMESERPDALFRDPFARRLAGPEGDAIVRSVPGGLAMAWAMIVRTTVLDELILNAIRDDHADLVLNLAAGLDARAYRLALPTTLRWVEVDLPDILGYKRDRLSGEQPGCRLESVALDLTDRSGRHALLERIGREAERVLVVTEGLLVYLDEAQVAALAEDLHRPPAFRWWLIDLASPRLLRMLQRRFGRALQAANSPMKFAPETGTDFFRPWGWRAAERRSMLEEAHRLRREHRLGWLWRFLARISPERQREEYRRMSAVVKLERVVD